MIQCAGHCAILDHFLEQFGCQNGPKMVPGGRSWNLWGRSWCLWEKVLEPPRESWNLWGASTQKGTKRLTLGRPLWRQFFFGFWLFFLQPDFELVFGWLLSWILEGFVVIFWVIFCVFLGHFGDAAAEVENVVWTHYLLQIKHMGICQHRRKTS